MWTFCQKIVKMIQIRQNYVKINNFTHCGSQQERDNACHYNSLSDISVNVSFQASFKCAEERPWVSEIARQQIPGPRASNV